MVTRACGRSGQDCRPENTSCGPVLNRRRVFERRCGWGSALAGGVGTRIVTRRPSSARPPWPLSTSCLAPFQGRRRPCSSPALHSNSLLSQKLVGWISDQSPNFGAPYLPRLWCDQRRLARSFTPSTLLRLCHSSPPPPPFSAPPVRILPLRFDGRRPNIGPSMALGPNYIPTTHPNWPAVGHSQHSQPSYDVGRRAAALRTAY